MSRITLTVAITATLALAMAVAIAWRGNESPAHAAGPYVVNTTGDPGVTDGLCDAVECTLREAVLLANATPGEIRFDIPGAGPHTIHLAVTLPALASGVTIDGQSEPDFDAQTGVPVVEILGDLLGVGDPCLALDGDSITVRGLAIGFCGPAISMAANTGAIIEGNYIGLRSDGTTAAAVVTGIGMVGSSNVRIGGDGVLKRNVISSATEAGIEMGNFSTTVPDDIRIEGNLIGTDATGTAARPNLEAGIRIISGNNVVVGVDTAGAGKPNVISGNGGPGIDADTASQANSAITNVAIGGNLVGLSATGDAALPNTVGVRLARGSNIAVGGTLAAQRNVISGNGGIGLLLGSGLAIGGATVEGNYIGLAADGLADMGNASHGIYADVAGIRIGATAAAGRNFISGNTGTAIFAPGGELTIINNWMGVDVTGVGEVPNNGGGVRLTGGGQNNIGQAGAGNVISGNGNHGIEIAASSGANTIQANRIGTVADGTAIRGNALNGIRVESGNNAIGGSAAGEGNVISANGAGQVAGSGNGIAIYGGTGNIIFGNLVGTNAAGTAALGNREHGILVDGGEEINIGSAITAGSGNTISGNQGDGIRFTSAALGFNQVHRNRIGTNSAGTAAVGNLENGIRTAATVSVGADTVPDRRNVISFNDHNGVCVEGALGSSIAGNEFFGNGRLGIDLSNGDGCLGTPLPNDLQDADGGPNGLQNTPVLSAFFAGPFQTDLTVSFAGAPNTQVRLTIFSSPTCDGSGFGEGAHILASLQVLTDGAGNASLPGPFNALQAGHAAVSSTATTDDGTSEFSNCLFQAAIQPTLTQITGPGYVTPGAPTTSIFLAGSGFVDSLSVVHVNGTPAGNSTVLSPTGMSATVPSSFFTSAGALRITVRNGALESEAKNLPVCGGSTPLLNGAHGVLWCGEAVSVVTLIDVVLPSTVSAAFEWSTQNQLFRFWFRGFPDGFQTIQTIDRGSFYFFQSNGTQSLVQANIASAIPFPQPGESFPLVIGAAGQIWGGGDLGLAGLAALNAALSAVFEWDTDDQTFDFWFRGFPDGFQTMQGLARGKFYFFQGNSSTVNITMAD